MQRWFLALFTTIISLGVTRGCSMEMVVSVLHRFMLMDEAPIIHDTGNRGTAYIGVLFKSFLAYYVLKISIMCTLRIQASGTFCLLVGAANQRNNSVETSNFAIYSFHFFFPEQLSFTAHNHGRTKNFLWVGRRGWWQSQKLYVVSVSF